MRPQISCFFQSPAVHFFGILKVAAVKGPLSGLAVFLPGSILEDILDIPKKTGRRGGRLGGRRRLQAWAFFFSWWPCQFIHLWVHSRNMRVRAGRDIWENWSPSLPVGTGKIPRCVASAPGARADSRHRARRSILQQVFRQRSCYIFSSLRPSGPSSWCGCGLPCFNCTLRRDASHAGMTGSRMCEGCALEW